MAYDSDNGYFHLMTTGWVRQDEEPFPEGRVETWHYTMSQASGWSREYRSLHCDWVSPDVSRADRDALREKFGDAISFPPSRDNTIGEPL